MVIMINIVNVLCSRCLMLMKKKLHELCITNYIVETFHFLTGKRNIYRLRQELGNLEHLSEMSITFCSRH